MVGELAGRKGRLMKLKDAPHEEAARRDVAKLRHLEDKAMVMRQEGGDLRNNP